MKIWFTGTKLSYKKLVLFALITGGVTALSCIIPFLVPTSFHDIAVYPDCWFLFAIFIIINCDSEKEAMVKCFLFFLISQPLVYLIQVPFIKEGWAIFRYYKYWFIATVLTIPGAWIAYQLNKKNWFSALILLVPVIYLSYMSFSYLKMTVTAFPYHIISMFFCLLSACFLIMALLDEKKHRVFCFGFMVLTLSVCFLFFKPVYKKEISLAEGEWKYRLSDPDVVNVKIEGDKAYIIVKHNGYTDLVFTDQNGDSCIYYVTVSGSGIYLQEE